MTKQPQNTDGIDWTDAHMVNYDDLTPRMKQIIEHMMMDDHAETCINLIQMFAVHEPESYNALIQSVDSAMDDDELPEDDPDLEKQLAEEEMDFPPGSVQGYYP